MLFSAAGVMLLIAAFPVWLVAAGSWTLARRSHRWAVTDGVVTASNVGHNRHVPGYHYRVRYEFRIGRTGYQGTLVTSAQFPYGTRRWATARSAQYPLGAAVRVYYDPEDPTIAVLEPGIGIETFFPIAMLGAAVIAAAGCFVAAWR